MGDGRHKRVWKACERCRIKKTKVSLYFLFYAIGEGILWSFVLWKKAWIWEEIKS